MKTRLLLTLIACFLALSSYADGTQIDGIYYELNSSTGTASVTYTGSSSDYNPSSTAYTGSITIPASVTYGGTTYSVTSIGNYAFYNCTGLTSITIPSSVTSIGYRAFYICTGLTSITIPSSVTSIGTSAFANCRGLTSIKVESGNKIYDSRDNCNAIIETASNSLVAGCKATSIPNSVTTIGSYAFWDCPSLTSITIGNSVTSIGECAFYGCRGLTSITIPNSVTSIGERAFQDCTGLTSITILNSVTSIGDWAFSGCTGLTSITIPSSVTSIGYYAFYDCSCVFYFIVKDEIYNPSLYGFRGTRKYCVQRGSKEALLIWNKGYAAYDVNTFREISRPALAATKTTPSTATLKIKNYDSSYEYTTDQSSASATITDPNNIILTGLKPGSNYSPALYARVKGTSDWYSVSNGNSFTTPAPTMETQQPKVISAGNVIVAAETNLDEAETNVGFEWRRTDWTDDFASNSGIAYLYGGTMEGYIRNLYTEKLWKYRPYYEASDGTRYYGDWVGLDPTNTSYFEPTVHTYATINVQSNTASVKGYAMRGTDNVAQQGFKYWKVSSSTRGIDEAGSRLMAVDIPAHAQTITASGQVMTATLTNLEYASDYCCVAFVTTTEGETFYGELQTFRTGEDVTGIGHVIINAADEANGTPTIVGYYNLQGQRIAEPQKGIVIVRYSDGTSRKMYVR